MAPLNMFVPQVVIQQRQSEGDPNAKCIITATGIELEWTGDENKMVSKYIPLNKSNIDFCFTASGYQNFSNFAALFGMPATYISDEEDETHEANTQSTTDNDNEITTLQLPGLPPPP